MSFSFCAELWYVFSNLDSSFWQVRLAPWQNLSQNRHPFGVSAAAISRRRYLLRGPCFGAWYLPDRCTAQLLFLCMAPISAPPLVTLLERCSSVDLESLSADSGADVESLVRQPEDVASYRREHTLGFILPSSTTSWSLRQAREFFTYGGTVSIISLSLLCICPLPGLIFTHLAVPFTPSGS